MIIGLVGYAGAGKTTVARAALESLSGWQHIGFSDPMVAMIRALGVPESIIADKSRWNESLPVLNGCTLRHAMQTLGTEWGRKHLGNDFWVNHAMQRAQSFDGHTIIDNVRFPNEFDKIEYEGGILIALRRLEAVPLTGEMHESEAHINQLQQRCHCDLYNDDTIASCAAKLQGIILLNSSLG